MSLRQWLSTRRDPDEIAHLRASLIHADRMRDDAIDRCSVALDILAGRDRDVARLQGLVDELTKALLARAQKITQLEMARKEQSRDAATGRFRRIA